MAGAKNSVQQLRKVGMIEGVSFLLLLGVAMPLKYFAGFPLAVKVVGWIHGILFIIFCVALFLAKEERSWSFRQASVFFVAALLPFGPFVVDKRLRALD